jgi:hypothetical protein
MIEADSPKSSPSFEEILVELGSLDLPSIRVDADRFRQDQCTIIPHVTYACEDKDLQDSGFTEPSSWIWIKTPLIN